MKRKVNVILLSVVLAVIGASADEVDYSDLAQWNSLGDFGLMAVPEAAGFALFESIDLRPANAPEAAFGYKIRCRVVYTDPNRDLLCNTAAEKALHALIVSETLNQWLGELIRAEFSGVDFCKLVARYYHGYVAKEINERFRDYVRERIEGLEDENLKRVCDMIEIVIVEVESTGDLRGWLGQVEEREALSRAEAEE